MKKDKEKERSLIIPVILVSVLMFMFFWNTIGECYIEPGKTLQLFLCSIMLLVLEKNKQVKFLLRQDVLFFISPLYVMGALYANYIVDFEYVVITYIAIGVTLSIFTLFVGNIRIGVCSNILFYLLLHIANDAVLQFRKNYLLPIDFLNVQTALSVSEAYMKTWNLSYEVFSAMIASIIFFYVISLYKKEESHVSGKMKHRLFALISCVVLGICAGVCAPVNYSPGEYTTYHKINKYGYIGVFYMELMNLHLKQPEDYSVERAEEIINKQLSKTNGSNPDIIVILDEAFSDLLSLGNVKPDNDYMPFIRELMLEHQSGKVYVPVWGGNTCNTEWELLTGNSMIFCEGTIPYTQYIDSDCFSVAAYLSRLDYSTSAIHPYYATGYRRNQVYPYMGFKEYIFIENMDSRYQGMGFDTRLSEDIAKYNDSYLRDLISDKASFNKLIDIYEKNIDLNSNQLIFNLTMQNHGPFSYKNFEGSIETNLQENHPDKFYVEQYLSLIKETDLAFKLLIEYFSKVERNTIILFVGDHQPGIGPALYNEMWGHEWNYENWSSEEILSRYEIPYVMWTNFEYELEHDYSNISSNFISLLLMDAAELDSNGWYSFMHDVYEKYPVITSAGIMDSERKWHINTNELLHSDEILKKYWEVQYYRMFDE